MFTNYVIPRMCCIEILTMIWTLTCCRWYLSNSTKSAGALDQYKANEQYTGHLYDPTNWQI